jgi:AcrR family transcriptional regulator
MRRSPKVPERGRPRCFDPEKALDRAVRVFWEKGYEGTSLSDLTNAMGINRPSLYATFGDKESLFRKVLDRYGAGPAAYVSEAMLEATGREAIEKFLRRTVESLTNPRNPKGCLLIQGALACGEEAEPIRRELAIRRATGEEVVIKRLKRAQAEGELPENVNAADLARFYVTVIRGLGVQAAGGAGKAELMRVAERAMQAWPKET